MLLQSCVTRARRAQRRMPPVEAPLRAQLARDVIWRFALEMENYSLTRIGSSARPQPVQIFGGLPTFENFWPSGNKSKNRRQLRPERDLYT